MLTTERYNQSKHPLVRGGSKSIRSLVESTKKKKQSAIAVLVQKSKRMTWNGKQHLCAASSPKQKSSQTLEVAHGVYRTLLGKLESKEIIPKPERDCRLEIFYGDYYVIVPVKEAVPKCENQARVVALDTGVRNFIGYYAEDGCGLIGENAFMPIYELCLRLDELKSAMSKAKCRQKQRLKKAFIRVSGKIKYMVDELHKKAARFLLTTYDIILIPEFKVSEMIEKTAKRKLTNRTVRNMLSLSHYKFKQYIKFKAVLMGKIAIEINEAFTTKTVSWTGEVIEDLGSKKVITSPSTQQRMHRDINAPRGIFIKSLVDTPMLTNYVKIRFVNES